MGETKTARGKDMPEQQEVPTTVESAPKGVVPSATPGQKFFSPARARPKLASIPTFYNGVVYRSRLEAKWAATFEECGCEPVYEPFDLNGWVPDFSIELFADMPSVLVEVKPKCFVNEDMMDKIEKAAPGKMVLIVSERFEVMNGERCFLYKTAESVEERNENSSGWGFFNDWIVEEFYEVFKYSGNLVQWKKPSLLCLHCGKEPYSL
jgi:hypothetical protein